jgi:hypothetical protein
LVKNWKQLYLRCNPGTNCLKFIRV